MDIKTNVYVRLAGIVMGVIGLGLLISRHPIQIGIVVLGAGIYFIGEYLQKNGQ